MRFGYRPDLVSMELVGGGVPDAPLLELSLEFVGRGALIAPLLALPVEPVGAVIVSRETWVKHLGKRHGVQSADVAVK